MAVSALKTWVPGEVLSASDLNNEFLNMLTNQQLLGWPATVTKDLNGQVFILDGERHSRLCVAQSPKRGG